jgi:glycerophosphoryl diester phosphodiesterase
LPALAISWQRSKGTVGSGILIIALWNLLLLALLVSLTALVRQAGAALLGAEPTGLGWTLPVVLSSLGLMALIGLVILVVNKVGLALLVLAAYEGGVPPGDPPEVAPLPPWLERVRPKNARISAWILALALLVLAGIGIADFADEVTPSEAPRITAHRGSSKAAPENTLSALRQAIEDGADYAEIDVQTTADGAVILQHDGDFMRVGGDPRRVADLTLEEVRALEVGSRFSPEFAGEPVATLEEAIDLCRGRLRLNIELKYNRADPTLAGKVGRILREEAFTDQCIVMSLNWDPLSAFAREFPEVRIGLIVFRAIGELVAVDADAFSMNAAQMKAGLVRSIHGRGAEVHVWTVNDPRLALRMIEMNVDNLITDRPGEMRRLLDDWVELTDSEKVALHLRRLLLPNETFASAEL